MMILTRGKLIVVAIFLGILAGLFGLVAFTNHEASQFESQITIALKDVEMKALDEQANVMTITVDFNVTNNAAKTLTISKMDYKLIANGKSLGQGSFSAESVPLSGRPPLFPSTSTTIPSEFRLKYSDDVSDLWGLLAKGEKGISWRVEGTAQIESALSLADVPFESSL